MCVVVRDFLLSLYSMFLLFARGKRRNVGYESRIRGTSDGGI